MSPALMLALVLFRPAAAQDTLPSDPACDASASLAARPLNQHDVGSCHASAAAGLLTSALRRNGDPTVLSPADIFVMGTVGQPYFMSAVLDAYAGNEKPNVGFPEGRWGNADVRDALANGVAAKDVVGDLEVMDDYTKFRSQMIDAMELYANPHVRRRMAALTPADEARIDLLVDQYYDRHAQDIAPTLAVIKRLTGWKDEQLKKLFRPAVYHRLSMEFAYEVLWQKFTRPNSAKRLEDMLGGEGRMRRIEASRREVLSKFRGFRLDPVPYGKDGFLKKPLAPGDLRRTQAWIETNLCRYHRPVLIGIDLGVMPNWRQKPGSEHDFLITGLRRDAGGRVVAFTTRNSWGGLYQDHDVPAQAVGSADELLTVDVPADRPR